MIVTSPPREKLLQIAQQLPASAQVLAQLGLLLTDMNSVLEDVACLLRRDIALAARVIRIANSAAYGSCGGIASIEDAVNRVGFAEVYRLTGFAAAAQMSDRDLPFYGITGVQLRDNTLVTALAMEALTKRVGGDWRVGYTAGLMRSTGKLVLDRLAKGTLSTNNNYSHSGLGGVLAWEQGFFGCTNVEVASLILDTWHFPGAITKPVKDHYMVKEPIGEHARVAILLNIASGITSEAGFALPGESTYWENGAARRKTVGVTEFQLRECANEAVTAFSALKGAL